MDVAIHQTIAHSMITYLYTIYFGDIRIIVVLRWGETDFAYSSWFPCEFEKSFLEQVHLHKSSLLGGEDVNR